MKTNPKMRADHLLWNLYSPFTRLGEVHLKSWARCQAYLECTLPTGSALPQQESDFRWSHGLQAGSSRCFFRLPFGVAAFVVQGNCILVLGAIRCGSGGCCRCVERAPWYCILNLNRSFLYSNFTDIRGSGEIDFGGVIDYGKSNRLAGGRKLISVMLSSHS